MKFEDIIVGAYFMFNGNKYRKNSNRTAKLLEVNRVFYFTKNEIVEVCKDEQ